MITHFSILLLVASFGFSISLLVETSAWVLKSMSTKSNHGFFNARAGIYVYGGRFFALLFMTVLSLLVDRGSNLQDVMIFITISVSLAAIIQLLYWNSKTFFKTDIYNEYMYPYSVTEDPTHPYGNVDCLSNPRFYPIGFRDKVRVN